jgi:threonine dehydrogenase-like Zn-dependent dehydrogenase
VIEWLSSLVYLVDIAFYVVRADIICARMLPLQECTHITAPYKDIRYIPQSGCTSEFMPYMRCVHSVYILSNFQRRTKTAQTKYYGEEVVANIMTYRLPDTVSWGEAALLEPLSVVLHGIRTTGLSLGRPVLICGAGPIGLIALAAARASGAYPIVITDLEPKRLAFAKKFEPNCLAYEVNRSLDAEGNAAEIRKLFGTTEYSAPSSVLECTGVESSVITATLAVRRGGVVCVIGVGRSVMNNLPFMHISLAEVSPSFLSRTGSIRFFFHPKASRGQLQPP